MLRLMFGKVEDSVMHSCITYLRISAYSYPALAIYNAGAALFRSIAIQNPEDYEARSNIMWAATWALNTLVSRGKSTDWMVHMLGQAVGAYTDATHGMTLSAVSLPYYRYIMPYGLSKFCRFAVNVWEVDSAGKADEQVAREGLSCMEVWMKELGLTMNLHELGATEEMLQGIANGTIIMEGGYKVLNHDEVLEILKNSL